MQGLKEDIVYPINMIDMIIASGEKGFVLGLSIGVKNKIHYTGRFYFNYSGNLQEVDDKYSEQGL